MIFRTFLLTVFTIFNVLKLIEPQIRSVLCSKMAAKIKRIFACEELISFVAKMDAKVNHLESNGSTKAYALLSIEECGFCWLSTIEMF